MTASRIAIAVGSAHSSAQHSHTRRRRSSSASSTPIIDSDPVSARAGQLQHHLLQGAPQRRQLAHRHARRDESGVQRGRVVGAHHHQVAVAVHDPPVEHPHRRRRIGRAHLHQPGGGAQGVEVRGEHQPSRAHHAHLRAERLDLAEQVAGQHHRGALRRELPQQRAHLADAAGVEAVGGLVEEQQLGLAQERGGDAEPLAHPQRVRPHGAAVDAAEADAHERLLDAVGAVPAAAAPAASMQPQVGPPRQVRPRRGPLHQRPDPRQHVRGRRAASAGRAARPGPRWGARAPAASAPAWSCPTRSARAARTARRSAR